MSDFQNPVAASSPSLRILLASSSSGSKGGGELFLAFLGEELAARGHQVALWCSNHPRMDALAARCEAFAEVLRGTYVNTYDRRGRSVAALFDRRTPGEVAAQWSSWRPNVIHVNKQNLEDGAELLKAADLCDGVRSVCTIHITQSARFLGAKGGWLRDLVARQMLRASHGTLIAVGPRRMDALNRFVGKGHPPAVLAMNGVPLPGLDRLADLRRSKRGELGLAKTVCVLAVGRMVAQKRPLLFLEHAKRLHQQRPGLRFVWVGDGDLAGAWDERVRSLGLADVVTRVNWVEEPLGWFAAADLLLHTAEFEGLPLAVLEAMGAALPCVVADDILPEGNLETEAGMAALSDENRWKVWLDDGGARERAGKANRETAFRRFSVQAMAARYEEIYLHQVPRTSC